MLAGLAGAALLFFGAFAPLVRVPVIGSVNYFHSGQGDGVIVVLLAAASLIAVLAQRFRALWATGIASLGLLAFTYVTFQSRLADARAELRRDLADNPFSGLGEAMLGTVQIEWGLAVLVVGSLLLLAAAYLGSRPEHR
jgi:hypothetical protein